MIRKPKHLKIGSLGEDLACRFLQNKGFTIIGRNYRKSWGEIDIIAEKEGLIHFVEVKTVSREPDRDYSFGPEENLHREKIARLTRAIQSYTNEHGVGDRWQADALLITLALQSRKAEIQMLEAIGL